MFDLKKKKTSMCYNYQEIKLKNNKEHRLYGVRVLSILSMSCTLTFPSFPNRMPSVYMGTLHSRKEKLH